MWTLYCTKQAQKDARKLASSGLKTKAQQLLTILKSDPWQTPPPFEKLVGDLSDDYSRRINIQHRLVYQVLEPEKVITRYYGCGLIMSSRVSAWLGSLDA
ncbi:Txe/YoeB family addiction module toxin [Amylibacter sp.]|nr:Txe/YoeB family addiction module toxin [Amylibacter sp.]